MKGNIPALGQAFPKTTLFFAVASGMSLLLFRVGVSFFVIKHYLPKMEQID